MSPVPLAPLSSAPPSSGRPAAGDRRNPLIDSIRALALLGVIVMNVSAMQMLFVGRELMADAGRFDVAAMLADLLLVQGKARACFAFLFGLGFAMMMIRAEGRGEDFRALYVRRMLGLLGFGLVNQIFLWWGDILVLYALLGLVLLLLRSWSEAALLRAGLLLVLAPPLVVGALEAVAGGPLPNLVDIDLTARGLVAMTSGAYSDFVRFAAPLAIERRLSDTAHMLIYDTNVFGLFLLGSWAARLRIAVDPDRHRPLLRRILWVCLPAGLLLSAVGASRLAGVPAPGPLYGLVTAAAIGSTILAFAWLAGLALLFAHGLHGLQRLLAPAGRMALTNYLASGAIGCFIFYAYGLGLLGTIGLVATNLLGVGIFAGLLGFSRLWLARFRLGPAEWLWRRLTYGRPAPPMRLAEAGT